MILRVKLLLVSLSSLLLSGLILGTFWFQDWQYALPTPKPKGLVQPAVGAALRPAGLTPDARPLFLHFFNPDCPCSRFNLDHVRLLVHDYGTRVQFFAVVETQTEGGNTPLPNYHLPMPALIDRGGRIAKRCGVYSTPQAVLLDSGGGLYYRGNYNVSRYCTRRSTEFARLALLSLLASHEVAVQPRAAVVAYGCQLPSNPALPIRRGDGLARFCRNKLAAAGGLTR